MSKGLKPSFSLYLSIFSLLISITGLVIVAKISKSGSEKIISRNGAIEIKNEDQKKPEVVFLEKNYEKVNNENSSDQNVVNDIDGIVGSVQESSNVSKNESKKYFDQNDDELLKAYKSRIHASELINSPEQEVPVTKGKPFELNKREVVTENIYDKIDENDRDTPEAIKRPSYLTGRVKQDMTSEEFIINRKNQNSVRPTTSSVTSTEPAEGLSQGNVSIGKTKVRLGIFKTRSEAIAGWFRLKQNNKILSDWDYSIEKLNNNGDRTLFSLYIQANDGRDAASIHGKLNDSGIENSLI